MWLVQIRLAAEEGGRNVGTSEFEKFLSARDARDFWRERGLVALLYPVLE